LALAFLFYLKNAKKEKKEKEKRVGKYWSSIFASLISGQVPVGNCW